MSKAQDDGDNMDVAVENEERDVLISGMKKNKIQVCTSLQEKLRDVEGRVTTLKARKTAELAQYRQNLKDLEDERARMNELRRDFGDKGKDHVTHLKRCHELDIRIKSLLSREIEINQTIKRYDEMTKDHRDKTRQLLRDLDTLRLGLETASRELEVAQDSKRDYGERVQRKEFEITRANYEYRTQVEGLKRLLMEREEIIKTMISDKNLADEETRRVSLAIQSVREEGARDIEALKAQLKVETDMISELTNLVSDLEREEEEKTETLENQIAKIKLQEKQIETDKATILGLHSTVNEGHANISALRLRLKDVINENAKMTQDLADNDAACVVVREKLENVQFFRDGAILELSKEETRLRKVLEELKEEIDIEHKHDDELTKAKRFARESEKKMAQMAHEEAEALASVTITNTRVELLQKDLRAVQNETEEQRASIERHLNELERVSNVLQKKEQDRHFQEKDLKERRENLEKTKQERDETIQRLKRAVLLTSSKLESLKAMLQETDQILQEDREVLEKKIEDVQSKDASLTGRLFHAEEEEYESETKLQSLQERVVKCRAKIDAKRNEIRPLISEFDNTMIDLKDNVSKEKNKMYEIEEKLSVVRTRCRANQLKLDQEIEQESKLQSRLREENLRLNQAKDRFEVQAQLEKEFELRVKQVEQDLKTAETRLENKTNECVELLNKLKSAQTKAEFHEKQIKDEQNMQIEMRNLLQNERKLVQEIDSIIQIKRGQFESDSNAVSERLLAYQKMLVDRTEAANRIGATIKAEIQTQETLRGSVEELETEMETERMQFKENEASMNEEEEELKASLADFEVSVMECQAEIQRTSEGVSDSRIKLASIRNKGDVLKDELDLTRRESTQLALQLETRGAKEKELFDSLTMKDATIKLLEDQLRDADGVDHSLRSQLRALEHEKKVLTEQVRLKQEREDEFIKELENTKMKFSTVAPPGDGDLQATMHREEAHREEYASTLLKMVK
jgi:chromosome segregation ATPase